MVPFKKGASVYNTKGDTLEIVVSGNSKESPQFEGGPPLEPKPTPDNDKSAPRTPKKVRLVSPRQTIWAYVWHKANAPIQSYMLGI